MKRTFVGALGIAAALTVSAPPAIAATPITASPVQTAVPTDKMLKDRIEYRLESAEALGKYDIHVKVEAQQVWLTGDVATAAQKAEAGRLAKVDGVLKVENDIRATPDADKTVGDRVKKGLNKTGEAITDTWITTKVHWFFMGEDLLKDSDIKVDVKDHVVTLTGTVKTKAGQARAAYLAQRPDGVKRVINLTKIG
jgi:osmotically-inducible protein OsmY